MKFIKLFLAGLLAFVVGSFVVSILWIVVLIGIASAGGTTTLVEKGSVLKIDLSEVIADAPSTDPFAGFDLLSMQSTPQLSLLEAVRALEAAAADERIDGIYLRFDGVGGVDGTAVLEELRVPSKPSRRAANSSSPTTRPIRRAPTTSPRSPTVSTSSRRAAWIGRVSRRR